MIKLFMLIMHVQNPAGDATTYVIELDMSLRACHYMADDYGFRPNPLVSFHCEEQKNRW